jgi:hypothetical protein
MRAHSHMSRATPPMRNFARCLIAYETLENTPSETPTPVAFHICKQLHAHMATFTGSAGFRALLARALVLTTTEVPWLSAVHVKADGDLEGLEELHTQLDPGELTEGGVVLLAQLLGLLVAFIGERLTLRLVSELWPKFSLDDMGLESRGKNEKTR